jgi:hypothetical protein
MMLPPRIKRQLTTIALIGGALRLLLLLLPKSFLVTYRLPDDAMYYFTIARNLASGHGISFDGVNLTNGFHPLWLLAITPLFWVTSGLWDSIYTIMTLQSLLDAAIVFAIGAGAYHALDLDEQRRHYAALAASLIYAFNPIAIIRGINGLETTLAALLLVVWLIRYLEYWRTHSSRYLTLAFISALVFLARTDLVFLLLPALIVLVVRDSKRGLRIGSLLIPALAGLAIAAPWLVWSKLEFGSFVQSSGEAVAIFSKTKYDIIFADGGYYPYVFSETLRSWAKLFVYSTVAVGVISLLLLVRDRTLALRPFAILLIGATALLAFHVFSRGFIRDWYVIQLIPIIIVFTAVGFAHFDQHRRLYLWITLSLLGCAWIWELTHPKMESQRHLSEIAMSKSDGRKAGFNSGYFGYFADGEVINLDGVVNNQILHYLRTRDLRHYIDSMQIEEIRDFRGTLGGYRNLFAPGLTEGFRLVDTIDAGDGEILETWQRTAAKP